MTVFSVFVIGLTFFAAALPLTVLSVIWDEISVNLTVGIPYVSILRTLLVAGAVLACIICDRLKGKRFALDMAIVALNIEAVGMVAFSMSRVFWNLALWSFVLGFGFGMSLTLLCLGVVYFSERRVMLYFVFSSMGALFGTLILDTVSNSGHSWRTSCQLLALFQIMLSLLLFFLFRSQPMKKRGTEQIQERGREYLRRRERERRGKEKEDGPADSRLENRYFLQVGAGYLAAALCGFLILAAAMLPQSYLVEMTGAFFSSDRTLIYGILLVAAGTALGRFLASLFNPRSEFLYAVCCALLILILVVSAILLRDSTVSAAYVFSTQFLSGIALGPIFPQLLMIDDVRLDRDAENSLIALLPACYMASLCLITPVAQALAGGGRSSSYALWMLAGAVLMALDLFMLCRLRGKKRD